MEVTCVCDFSSAAARRLAKLCGVKNVYTSIDEMLSSGDCEAVHILTPPNGHAEGATKALQHGMDVLADKSTSVSPTERNAFDSGAMILTPYGQMKHSIKAWVADLRQNFVRNITETLKPQSDANMSVQDGAYTHLGPLTRQIEEAIASHGSNHPLAKLKSNEHFIIERFPANLTRVSEPKVQKQSAKVSKSKSKGRKKKCSNE